MYTNREELKTIAHEAIMEMLSYNVDKLEAYQYLTNKLHLMYGSYELQCCIYDLDPVEYIRICDEVRNDQSCSWPKKRGPGAYPL